MPAKAVALISGGIDSTLAVKVIQAQGIEVEGLNVRTAFECCSLDAQRISHELGVRLNFVTAGPEYLELIEAPKYGRGKGINPCVDCRAYMFVAARRLLEACGADFVVSGEVLGQRPMSQKRHDFDIIERESGLEGRIVRPLSAKLLPPTIAERDGLVDRERMFAIQGRSRKEIIALARSFGMRDADIPTPSVGCALTEPDFGRQVMDVFAHQGAYETWDFDLLKVGRQFRIGPDTKIALGRCKEDNDRLTAMARAQTTLFQPANFHGPNALAVGTVDEKTRDTIGRIIMRYTKHDVPDRRLRETRDGEVREYPVPEPFTVAEAEGYAITARVNA